MKHRCCHNDYFNIFVQNVTVLDLGRRLPPEWLLRELLFLTVFAGAQDWSLTPKNLMVISFVGLHEAVYQGVPMLCVPLFGDQPNNAKKLKVRFISAQQFIQNKDSIPIGCVPVFHLTGGGGIRPTGG